MLKRYFIILVVFLVIDFLWLGLIAPKLYQKHIGHLMAEKVSFLPAIIFYLIYALALLVFVVNPAVENKNLMQALVKGLFLGFVMYATYDLTNQATLRDWPATITIIDLIWGSFVTAMTCIGSTYTIQYFNF